MGPNCLAPSRVFYLVLDQRLTSLSKKSNEVGLFWSSVSIKLDGLRMLEVRRPIVNFFCSKWYPQKPLSYKDSFEGKF